MSIRIVLDNPQSLYTNLDFVAGKAILSLTSNETITAITVKLEGESKTRLLGEAFNPYGGFSGGYRRAREPSTIETEVHKVCPQPMYVAVIQIFFSFHCFPSANHARRSAMVICILGSPDGVEIC